MNLSEIIYLPHNSVWFHYQMKNIKENVQYKLINVNIISMKCSFSLQNILVWGKSTACVLVQGYNYQTGIATGIQGLFIGNKGVILPHPVCCYGPQARHSSASEETFISNDCKRWLIGYSEIHLAISLRHIHTNIHTHARTYIYLCICPACCTMINQKIQSTVIVMFILHQRIKENSRPIT